MGLLRASLRRRWLRVLVALVLAALAWHQVRKRTRPKPPRPDELTFQQALRVRIVRDEWGVPHIFGKSDADAAFGLAYANAEDDFPTIQGVFAAAGGKLSLLLLNKIALGNDYYVSLVRVREQVDEQWPTLDPAYRALLEGYARGLNLYAYLHPGEADARLFPLTGKDVAAGFPHKVPLMFDLPDVLAQLGAAPPKHAGARLASLARDPEAAPSLLPGSNAHAVSAHRSADGVARLNVNSHQPWEGPVSWYEAQVVSDEGWNMTGALFPGSPVILHGHNEHLGWAHTVNAPDLIDVYELRMQDEETYILDGVPHKLEVKQAPITIDTGLFDVTVHKAAYWSEQGPVFKAQGGTYAIRYAGIGRAVRAGEQWYRMNKARSLDEWKAAMRMQAIPMFNTVYADAENIFYVYNALLPVRSGGYDYQAIVPGDVRATLWTDYLPWDALPSVENPPSGFVQSCNSTPFSTTVGDGNPRPADFPTSAGIETHLTNRAVRSLALLGGTAPITRDDFLAMKWDRAYDAEAAIFRDAVRPALAARATLTGPGEQAALDVLAAWDGRTDETSTGAALAILTWRGVTPKAAGAGKDAPRSDAVTAFRAAVQWLVKHHGKVDVAWGKVMRLHRGTVDLALGGGPDVLNAVAGHDVDGHLVGYQGDSYVLIAELDAKGGARSTSIHQYGASCRVGSPHHADQAAQFAAHQLKPTLREVGALVQHTERAYHPGE